MISIDAERVACEAKNSTNPIKLHIGIPPTNSFAMKPGISYEYLKITR